MHPKIIKTQCLDSVIIPVWNIKMKIIQKPVAAFTWVSQGKSSHAPLLFNQMNEALLLQ